MTELRIIVAYKRYLIDLIEVLEYVTKKEKYVKDLLLKNSFLLLEHIYEVNLFQKSKEILKVEISILDYYFE